MCVCADVETYVSLMTPHLLARLDQQEAGSLSEELCSVLSSEVRAASAWNVDLALEFSHSHAWPVQVDEHAEIRLQGLTQVFNTLSQPELQLKAFAAACSYAQRAGLSALLSPVVKVQPWHACQLLLAKALTAMGQVPLMMN